MSDLNLFDHIFVDNKASKTIFFLHGTGGTKSDFLFLDEFLEKKYNFVGLQGNVDEHGHARFFRRLSEGVFDQESIREETHKLKQFIDTWMDEYKVSIDDLVFLGYSNGANMILATLFYTPELISKAVLLHTMLPFKPKKSLDLSKHSFFVSLGEEDPMISEVQQSELIQTLQSSQAQLTIKRYNSGHHISAKEVRDVVDFLLAL
jgi:phospholipase/carboxylesterase